MFFLLLKIAMSDVQCFLVARNRLINSRVKQVN